LDECPMVYSPVCQKNVTSCIHSDGLVQIFEHAASALHLERKDHVGQHGDPKDYPGNYATENEAQSNLCGCKMRWETHTGQTLVLESLQYHGAMVQASLSDRYKKYESTGEYREQKYKRKYWCAAFLRGGLRNRNPSKNSQGLANRKHQNCGDHKDSYHNSVQEHKTWCRHHIHI
jgi:hypothetical protein